MKFTQFNITANSESQEILVALLDPLGFESFQETESKLLAFINEDFVTEDLLHRVQETLIQLNIKNFTTESLPNINWNEKWEQNFPFTIVRDQVYVHASFHPEKKEIPYPIRIEPKMSFGTGHHPTTFQMIEALLDADLKNKSLLDLGSGTGVLAILAEKIGAMDVLAIDYDDWCIENMAENQRLNNTVFKIAKADVTNAQEMEFVTEGRKFDFILANINRNLLLNSFENLKERLNKNSVLITSGYYVEDEKIIENTVHNVLGLKKTARYSKNNWIVNTFKK